VTFVPFVSDKLPACFFKREFPEDYKPIISPMKASNIKHSHSVLLELTYRHEMA
jgi:hypothetical protein